MAEDHIIRWPHHRHIVEQIISGTLKKLGCFDEARPNDYIELYSAPPFATGRNGVHSTPETNALEVIIRVTKFEKGDGRSPNFIYWDSAVVKMAPDADMGFEVNQYKILRALNDIGGDSGVFTPSEILAVITGIPVQEVEDHLEILEQEDKVKHVVTTGGSAAFMQPRGRFHLKEAAMPTKPSTPAPRLDILLTWSGMASHEIASFFHRWLPSVLPGTQPWISDEDIAKGKKWFTELTGQLSKTNTSITFITPENVRSPWIYFEVGAIAAKLEGGVICPYLVGVEQSQVKDTPLGQFQWTEADKRDTWKLIRSINQQLGDRGHDSQLLDGNFNSQWPKLKRQIDRLTEALSAVGEDVVGVEPSIEQQLSNEARQLLLAAFVSDGQIMYARSDGGGAYIGTEGKNMIEELNPRNEAVWKAALDELIDFDLVESVGRTGDVFKMTRKGYDVADLIRSREA
jgi:hypothetical protein